MSPREQDPRSLLETEALIELANRETGLRRMELLLEAYPETSVSRARDGSLAIFYEPERNRSIEAKPIFVSLSRNRPEQELPDVSLSYQHGERGSPYLYLTIRPEEEGSVIIQEGEEIDSD